MRVAEEQARANRISADPRVVADQAAADARTAFRNHDAATQALLTAERAANQDPLNRDLARTRDQARQREFDLRVIARDAEAFAQGTREIAENTENRRLMESIRAGHAEDISTYRAMIRDICNRAGIPLPEGFQD